MSRAVCGHKRLPSSEVKLFHFTKETLSFERSPGEGSVVNAKVLNVALNGFTWHQLAIKAASKGVK